MQQGDLDRGIEDTPAHENLLTKLFLHTATKALQSLTGPPEDLESN